MQRSKGLVIKQEYYCDSTTVGQEVDLRTHIKLLEIQGKAIKQEFLGKYIHKSLISVAQLEMFESMKKKGMSYASETFACHQYWMNVQGSSFLASSYGGYKHFYFG